nr:flagellar FlbD family protein [Amphibacillus marinus]
MIQLTHFRGDTFILNAMFIERVQALPDTTITLHSGKKLVVKESVDDVVLASMTYYQQIGLVGSQQKVGVNNDQQGV